MTLEEAKEAGVLAVALDELEEAIAAVGATQEDHVGLSCSIEHSDSGSTGLGPDVIVTAALAEAALASFRRLLTERLVTLGVRP